MAENLRKTVRRALFSLLAMMLLVIVAYWIWSPGLDLRDGRHDRLTNAIWLGHGWLGDDSWFERNQRDATLFREASRIDVLSQRLRDHHITDVFPHLCPCDPTGRISPVDDAQVELFLAGMPHARVIPWIGGVFESSAWPSIPAWRKNFVDSSKELLARHPRLAGLHVNIEPLPSGHAGFLELLDELRAAIPEGKILSVAAYPPPTRWQPSPDVHWEMTYFQAVASRVDQVAVMMYDTSIPWEKPYRKLMNDWSQEVLAWSPRASVLLGVAVYDDADSGYHHPHVENLSNGLLGIHAGLAAFDVLPGNYQGVAIYSEWEMDDQEWKQWRERFMRNKNSVND